MGDRIIIYKIIYTDLKLDKYIAHVTEATLVGWKYKLGSFAIMLRRGWWLPAKVRVFESKSTKKSNHKKCVNKMLEDMMSRRKHWTFARVWVSNLHCSKGQKYIAMRELMQIWFALSKFMLLLYKKIFTVLYKKPPSQTESKL